MNIKAKLAAYNTMKAPQHGSKDYDLLKRLAPYNKFVQKAYVQNNRLANEIFLALLDYATPDEIKQNRRGEKKVDFSLLSGEAGTRTAQLEKAESIEQADSFLAEITDIAKQLPKEAAEIILTHATGAHTKVIGELKAALLVVSKEKAEKSLLDTQLENLDYQARKSLIKDLNIEPKDFKSETLLAALIAHKADLKFKNLEKKDSSEEVEELTEELENKDSENTELKDKVENLEGENETLQEQVDELESENEDLKVQPGTDKKKDSLKNENTQK